LSWPIALVRATIAVTGADQDAQCLTITAGARRSQVLTAESFAGGADRVQVIGLGSVPAGWPGRAVDLGDPFAVLEQCGGQPGPVAAGALDRPHAPPGGVLAGERRKLPVAERVGMQHLGFNRQPVQPGEVYY
jgi:hypothetical protein